MARFGLNEIITAAFLVYVAYTIYNLAILLNPAWELDGTDHPDSRSVSPAWERGSEVKVEAWLGKTSRLDRERDLLIWKTSVEFGAHGDTRVSAEHRLRLVASREDDSSENVFAAPDIIEALMKNETPYINFFVSRGNEHITSSTELVRFYPPLTPRQRGKRRLLEDFAALRPWLPTHEQRVVNTAASQAHGDVDGAPIGYFKPIVSIHLVSDWTEWPLQSTPHTVLSWLRPGRQARSYLPVVFTDQLGLTRDQLVQVNASLNAPLDLTVSISPISVQRWMFNAHMERAFEAQKNLGFEDKDIDELRLAMVETHPVLLSVTMVISMLHILFDVLAFKSDVSFWYSIKSLRGLSKRTVFIDLICQIIIAAYLYEEETTILVLAPSVLSIFLQAWKCTRVVTMSSSTPTEDRKREKGATDFSIKLR